MVRRQDELLKSFYGGAANLGLGHFGMRQFPDIDTWLATAPKYAPVRFVENMPPLTAIGYHDILREFVAAFGKERVHVLLYEQFVEDKEAFAAGLGAVLDVPTPDVFARLHDAPKRQAISGGKVVHKVSFSPKQKQGGSLLNNRISRRLFRAIAPLLRPTLEPEIGAEWQRHIAEACGAGNRWMAREFGLPLARYGYPGCDPDAGQLSACERTEFGLN